MPAPSKRRPATVAAQEAPRSAANFHLNLVGLAGGLFTIYAPIRWAGDLDALIGPLPWNMGSVRSNHLLVAVAACAVVFAIIGGSELLWMRTYLNPATGLAGKALRGPDFKRVLVRLLGFALTLGVIALAYWLFPEYHGSFYEPFWGFLGALAIPVLPLAPLYFVWTDMRLANPHDSYWQLGMLPIWLLQGRGFGGAEGPTLAAHFMGWTVKAFFLPLMINYLNGDVGSLSNYYGTLSSDGMTLYHFLYELSYTVDLLFCVVGYTITLRLFDSHIRSTEPTAFGWVIALVCYQPFYSVIGNYYLRYDDSIFWDNWFSTAWLRDIWAAAIIALLFVYSLSTVAFGLRFSNLTYRGIITGGPYRYTKHPAYLSKNLSWWLISVPWIPESHWYEALRNCCLLGLLNLVYYLRARTEENHLSLRDPAYVAYALWINEHGLLSRLGQWLPFLRYKPPMAVGGKTGADAART